MLAEAVGTGLLVCAVIGSGIAAQRLSPDDVGLQLLENAIATGAALAVLIVVLQPVSAAFNPRRHRPGTRHRRHRHPAGRRLTVAAQLAGGAAGAVLANLMFGEPAVDDRDHRPVRAGALAGRGGGHRRPDARSSPP